ncbi:MAG: SIS domain-containing protein [Dehalococcoidia bacterium]
MYQTAAEYFTALSERMLAMQVTDGKRAPLTLDQGVQAAVDAIIKVGASHRKIMLVGNGGSAAIVSHVQNDLCKAVGVKALVFTEQPLLLALANDHGYECVYERPVQLWAEAGDLMIAVSSSGNSENILRAARASLERDCRVITMSGFGSNNALRQMGSLNFYVDSNLYGHVETAHAALLHFMTDTARAMRNSEEALSAPSQQTR